MTPILVYFLKVNLALAILYISYRLLFQHDTFFRLRRGALLSIYLIAFLYQLPDISDWLSARESISDVIVYYSSVFTTAIPVQPDPVPSATNWKETGATVLQMIYLSGVLILLFRCLAELASVCRIHFRNKKTIINGMQVCILPEKEEAYSFFKWIFMSVNPNNKQITDEILLHEATHVRQLHSLDILLGEIVTIFCWMNPFAWLLKKEIGINHEYIADQQVMYAGYNKKEYQYHLIGMKHPDKAVAKLYNNFSVLPLKKRITMLNKKRTNSVRKVKYLALIPMAVCLLLINNIDAMARIVSEQVSTTVLEPVVIPEVIKSLETLPPDDDKVYTVVEKMPEFPGGTGALLEFLKKNKDYPVIAIENGIEGRVSVSFIVEKDGSISNIEVIKSVDPSLDKAAVKVTQSMPKWKPAEEKGKVVRVKYTLPVTFKLKDVKKAEKTN